MGMVGITQKRNQKVVSHGYVVKAQKGHRESKQKHFITNNNGIILVASTSYGLVIVVIGSGNKYLIKSLFLCLGV